MKNKFFAFLLACVFVLNIAGVMSADTKSEKNQISRLAALLPASDGVITLDVKRFFAVALPQILSGNKTMLDEINGKIDDFKIKTGIDARQFEQVAVGVSGKQIAPKKVDLDAVVLARGSFNASALATAAKIAADGKYREEKIGDRAVYVFSPKEIVEKSKPNSAQSSKAQKFIDKILGKLPNQFAVTAYDNNTLAFGSLTRVREALEAKTRVSSQLLDLINRKEATVMSFAANLPNGISDFISLGGDELGQTLDSIRQVHGLMNVVGENTIISATAKTLKPEQAESLSKSLESLQQVFSPILLGSKNANQKIYGRILEKAKISRVGSEITLDAQVQQSDINVLIGAK